MIIRILVLTKVLLTLITEVLRSKKVIMTVMIIIIMAVVTI